MIPENKPRIGKNSEKSGAYEQCIKLITPVIHQGDMVKLEQYFTGYGEIDGVKIAFYPSSEIFEGDSSFIINGIKKEDGKIMNGGNHHPFTDTGVIMHMQGIEKSDWKSSTQFFDVSDGDLPQLYTETKQVVAPFQYDLKTKKSVKPGIYGLEFVFTYFNGSCWVSSTKNVEFKVQNFFERYANQIGILAVLASLSALVRFAVIPLFNELIKIIGKLCG
jgi:hypothetical protein